MRHMLQGELVGLRAREASDVAILHAEFYDDVLGWSRSHGGPWRPITAASGGSRYEVRDSSPDKDEFSVVTLRDGQLIGHALLWGIDTHNRTAHVGLSLKADCRGRGYGRDVVDVLCHYGFEVRGLHRLQVDTLADNAAMISAAQKVGFSLEGTLRSSAWLAGEFVDEVILGLLATEWSKQHPG